MLHTWKWINMIITAITRIIHQFDTIEVGLPSKFLLPNSTIFHLWSLSLCSFMHYIVFNILAVSTPKPNALCTHCPLSVCHYLPVIIINLTLHIFDLSSATAEQNLTKPERKQEHNILYHVCVFQANRKNSCPGHWLAENWANPLTKVIIVMV